MAVTGTIATEGRRERKRRETHARITEVAMALFLERGFAETTVDDIATAADVSKRTFFDYFPSKDALVTAWQDQFAHELAEEILRRPDGEPVTTMIEEAMTDALLAGISAQSMAISQLIRNTPALAKRNQAKYVTIEDALVGALAGRLGEDGPRIRLVAMVAVGVLRLGVEAWHTGEVDLSGDMRALIKAHFSALWETLAEIGESARRS